MPAACSARTSACSWLLARTITWWVVAVPLSIRTLNSCPRMAFPFCRFIAALVLLGFAHDLDQALVAEYAVVGFMVGDPLLAGLAVVVRLVHCSPPSLGSPEGEGTARYVRRAARRRGPGGAGTPRSPGPITYAAFFSFSKLPARSCRSKRFRSSSVSLASQLRALLQRQAVCPAGSSSTSGELNFAMASWASSLFSWFFLIQALISVAVMPCSLAWLTCCRYPWMAPSESTPLVTSFTTLAYALLSKA